MADVCPDALFLNYTNPMGMLVRAVDEAVGVPTVGLCHSVYWTVDTLAGYLGVPPSEVVALSAGVNHLAWILRLEHQGRDLYPDLAAFVEAGRVPDDDLVRADLFARFGFYPTESSEHHAEYNPWFIPKGQVEAFHVPLGEYLSRVANNLDEYEATKQRLDAGEPFEIERSGEYAAVIINAIATGVPARIVANVMNFGPAGPGGGPRSSRTSPPTHAWRSRRWSTRSASSPPRWGRCRPSARPTRGPPSTARSSPSARRSTRTATSCTTPCSPTPSSRPV